MQPPPTTQKSSENMCTTIALAKQALGHSDDDGYMPRIVFEPVPLGEFIKTTSTLWLKICTVKKVINEQAICPLDLFNELCCAQLRAYYMFHSFPILQSLNKLQPGDDGFVPHYFPNYSPSKLRGIFDVPVLTEVLNIIKHTLRPQVDVRTGHIILRFPPRITIYTLGAYPDNRLIRTRILLSNAVMSGTIDQMCLKLGIPLRRNVLEFVNNKFCTGYATTVTGSFESLAFIDRTYFLSTGVLRDSFGPDNVGAYNDGADGNQRNIPWDPDWVPIPFRGTSWDLVSPPPDPNHAGCVLNEFPEADFEQGDATRPWYLENTVYTEFQSIPRATLLDCGAWPPFSDSASPLRTAHMENVVPQRPRNPVVIQGQDNSNFPSKTTQKMADAHGNTMRYHSMEWPIDESRSKCEYALPQTTFYRPNGQDANPPNNLRNQTQRMGRPGFIAGFNLTWGQFDSMAMYTETDVTELRGVTHSAARDGICTDIVLNLDKEIWPAIGTTDPTKSTKSSFVAKTRTSRRQRTRKRRDIEKRIDDPGEVKTADRPNPAYEGDNHRSERQDGKGKQQPERKGRDRRRNRKRNGNPRPEQNKDES